mgnify:CR=1 FL=1
MLKRREMFTIEFDDDETLITVMDSTGELEDVSGVPRKRTAEYSDGV